MIKDIFLVIARKILYLVEPKRNLHEADGFSQAEVNVRVKRWGAVLQRPISRR